MYKPEYSENDIQDLALELIRKYPLGLLVSAIDNDVEANYLPFFAIQNQSEIILVTHFAKANPHWKNLKDKVLVSFQGPHRYISPTLYKNKLNVPTWSYAAVQIQGTVEIIVHASGIKDILNQTVSHFETQNGTSWSYDLPLSFQEKLESAIVGIKIKVDRIEAKFKLSQNRNQADYHAVLNFLKNSPSQQDQEVYHWMMKTRG